MSLWPVAFVMDAKTLLAVFALIPVAHAETVEQRELDGIHYTLILDAETSPCGPLKFNEGCTVISSEKPRVYVSSNAPQWVIDHELEHVRGMRHSQWRNTPRGVCCFVYDAGSSKKYERGDILCNINGTEQVIRT